jgi:hypothetical protein
MFKLLKGIMPEPYPLSGPQGNSPSWSASGQLKYNLNNLPKIHRGKLGLGLAGIMLRIQGALVNTNSAASAIYQRRLVSALFSDFQVDNAWHGTPVSSNAWKSKWYNAALFAVLGSIGRKRAFAPSFTGDIDIEVLIPLIAPCVLEGHHGALPTLCYQKAELVINTAAASALTDLSTGASFTGTVKAYAVTLPQDEISIGAVPELAMYTAPYVAGQTDIELRSFGNNSAMTHVDTGAAILSHYYLTYAEGQGGVPDDLSQITQINVPYRGLTANLSDATFYCRIMDLVKGLGRMSESAVTDYEDYPYPDVSTTDASTYPYFLPIVDPPEDTKVTKLYTADGPDSFNISQSGGTGTEHKNLVWQLRSITAQGREELREILVKEGVARAVCGTDDVVWAQKTAKKQDVDNIFARKLRYLPWKLVPRSVTVPSTRVG